MSLTIKFRDRKSTCNDGHSLLIPFSSREDIIWPLDPYIISALNVIPHHSHMHLHLLNWIRTQECSGASNMASSSAIKALSFLAIALLLSHTLVTQVLCRQLSENRQSEKEASKSSTQTKVVRTYNSFFAGWCYSIQSWVGS
jgi:hypothetical protein